MMTEATTKDYWISPQALRLEPNALGNPDYLQASCTAGAQILVYVKDIIGYDAGHNYRRWPLQASPTVFNTHTIKYVYAAIPRTTDAGRTAQIVFPSERIDIYGLNEAEEQKGNPDYYYIFLQGILTASGDNGTTKRTWQQRVATGYLSSDEAVNAGPSDTEWYQYSTVDGIVTFLKNLAMKAGTEFARLFARTLTIVSGGRIEFEGQDGSITGMADATTPETAPDKIVTPQYMDDNALSKRHDDETPYSLGAKDLVARSGLDVFGNTRLHGPLTVGQYNKRVEGAHVDFYGNAEFESIVSRSFIESPELRYNRTTITVGNKWQTKGAGIIEHVWNNANLDGSPLSANTRGVACLKLEPGEAGAIAVDDKCQGVFHIDGAKNDPSTTDSRDGNFHFAGFTTIYFVITEIYTADTLPQYIKDQLGSTDTVGQNQYFAYELRAATCAALPPENRDYWTDATHPQPGMHFAAYANATNADRQASRLTTTTYQLHLAGMTGWTYTEANMRLIIGWLTGFSFLQRVWDNTKGEFVEVTKELNGEGIATGNIYMWGSIDQFDRVPQLVAQQPYYKSTETADPPEGIILSTDGTPHYELNGWSADAITPTATARIVWQQWLYTYSDGTYRTGQVAFHAAHPTALTVLPSQSIVSVALSDWYDTAHPDDIEINLSARLMAGSEPVAITEATAQYADGNSGSGATIDTAGSSITISDDGTTAQFRLKIKGYVGVTVDGTTPEDSYITLTLTSAIGTASGMVAIAQNREGEQGAPGEQGKPGAAGITVRRTEWEEGVQYRNDSSAATAAPDGQRYLDEVSVTSLATGTAQWYVARPAHNGVTSSAANKPSTAAGNDYWEPVNDMRPLRTSFADIMTAFIKFLQVNQIQITDENGTPYGAFGGGKDMEFPLWFGGTDAKSAITKFNRQGDAWIGKNFSVVNGAVTCDAGEFNNVKVKGSLRNPFTAADDSFDVDYSDNAVLISYPGGNTVFSLPWTPEQNGRRVTLVNYRWEDSYAGGWVVIYAPEGMYFFEDGLQKSSIKMSRETVELMGYGAGETFYGWIVTRRVDMMPAFKYGRSLKALAIGTVTGTDTTATISYKAFDNGKMEVTRHSEGVYRMTYPSDWVSKPENLYVMLTGRGRVFNGDTPCKASIADIGKNEIWVDLSDDNTRNDGSFDFIVYNRADFES